MSPEIWGSNPEQYNPDRFLSLPQTESTHGEKGSVPVANDVPGTWGNLLTFLGGARNCIGYRFALVEMKAILFVLIRNLEFQELASKPTIQPKQS